MSDPTELAVSLLNPNGTVAGRLGADEAAVADIPTGLGFTTSDPGGFKDSTFSLARAITEAFPDVPILRALRIYGHGERTAWEGRLHETPGHAADAEEEIPGAVGHVARLDDDPSFAELYIDRDLSGWGSPSLARAASLAAGAFAPGQVNMQVAFADTGAAGPGLYYDFINVAKAAGSPFPGGEFWYYGGGIDLGRVFFDQIGDATTTWIKACSLAQDDAATGAVSSASYNGVAESLGQAAPAAGIAAAGKKYAFFQCFNTVGGPYTMANVQRFLRPTVIGRHGLTVRGTWPTTGLYASDVIADIVKRTASDLNFTVGEAGTIQPSTFAIPHLTFREGVKGSDAILGVNAFHQRSWGVYEDKTFFWRPSTEYRKRWRIRRSRGHGVDLLGPQAEDAYNGVVCTFTDPAGVVRVVGPPGCPTAYATSAALADTSASNPVNQAGIAKKWAELKLGFVTTTAGAIQVAGAWLLDKLQTANSRGSVVVAGMVEDDATGVAYPAWCMRAGDSAIVTDGDNVERGIIETAYDHDTRTCTASMDATPHKMEALMERMGVALVGVVG